MKNQLRFLKQFIAIITLGIVSSGALAQQVPGSLTVDTAMPVEQMVQNLVGPGVQISNVQVTGASGSYGYYNITGTEIGTSEGIILSTGQAINAIGPNDETGLPLLGPPPTFTCLNCSQYQNNTPGSTLLNQAQSRTTFDAAQIEFDIIPQGDSLRFRYTFASEEYNEWVGSPFNDVFGFYISGPNIGNDVNIALVPNTSTIVSINTVNANQNSEYWVNNMTPPGQGFQFDGFTIDLVAAVGNLIPCETYHLVLVIADGSDRIYDSNVLISQIESNPVIVATATAGGLDYMIEGCNDGLITFSRNEATPFPQNVTYYIGGSAINGVDFTLLGNGIPNEPITATIPGNQTSVSIPIEAFADEILEGSEFITIYLENPTCTADEFLDSINFFIEDFLEVDIQPDVAEICAGQCVELTGITETGGSATFQWSPTTDLSNSNTLTPTACPTSTSTYTLTAEVAECVATDNITINVSFISLGIDTDPVTCPNGGNGSIDLTVLNANAPFTYSWTGPAGFESDIEDPQNLEDGEYCVTVTDASGCVASGCVTIFEVNILQITDVNILLNGCFPISCFGACDGAVNTTVTGGTLPYSFAWLDASNNIVLTTQNATGLCAGVYTFRVTDANGCELTNQVIITEPDEVFVNLIGTVDVLCDGTSTGSITVDAAGGCAPYFYQWSGFPQNQTPVLSNIPSGNYAVSVTDINGCLSGNTLDIIVNDPINPLEVTLDEVSLYPGGFGVSCPGATDGFINVTASLGTAPYTFEWVRQSTGQVIATTEDVSGLSCGVYVFTATDANGCEESLTVNVTCVPELDIDFTVTPNPCGDDLAGIGAIDITNVTGGHGGPYLFVYNGPSCAPCLTEDISNLNSGDYLLTVTDALGCTADFSINVGTNDLFTITSSVTDASCGGTCDGQINITVDPVGAYVYSWTNENNQVISSAEDISGLCAGDYSVSITADDCQEVFFFTVNEPTPISIQVIEVENPTCFGQNNGSIEIDVTGGTGPYTYLWTSNGCVIFDNTTQDLSGLLDCCYTVTVTDATGCTETLEVCLEAPQVMDLFVTTPSDSNGLFDVSCNGASDGSISLTVSGGTPDCTTWAPECYFIEWSVDVTQFGNPANSGFITNLPGGTYAVNVTDANGCLATTTINLTEPQAIQSNAVITDVTCNGNNDGSITPNIFGGSGVFVNYLWNPSVSPNADDAATLTNLDPGCYTLVVTDSFDCSETFTYCVEEPETLTANLDVTQPTPCTLDCDGIINVSVSGGTLPYSIIATDDSGNTYSGELLTDLCDGIYSISVTDANGCTVELNTTLESTDPYQVIIQPNTLLPGQLFTLNCNGDCNGSLTALPLGGAEPFAYVWTDLGGNVIGNEATINDLCAGNYCVQVTDGSGCIVVECFEVTQPDELLTVNANVSLYPGGYNVSCFGACDASIDLTVTGGVPGYTFLWDDGNGLDPNEDQFDLCAAFHEVLVTDENGCFQRLEFDLTEPAPIVINETISTFDGGANVSCNGSCDGSITIEVLGGDPGYTIEWVDLAIIDQTTVTGLCAGVYTVLVTDAIGCTQEETYTLNEPEILTATLSQSFDCNTGTTTICAAATGGSATYSFVWENGETTNCIEETEAGEYCVTITDSNGCETTACITIDGFSPIEISPSTQSATCGICNGSILIGIEGGNGNYTIDWTGTGTQDGNIVQNDLCSGTYTVNVFDNGGCNTTVSIFVGEVPATNVQAAVTGVSCFGDEDGSILAEWVNPAGNISFSWTYNSSPFTGDLDLTNLAPGLYELTWTDENGCEGSELFTVLQPQALIIQAELSLYDGGFNVSENGGNNGAIDVTVEGGTPDYSYDWSHLGEAIEPQDVANLVAGDYTLIVTDANGCQADSTFTITQPTQIEWMTGLTPNGDGFNDVYVIRGIEKYRSNEFKVFNRWGNLVYDKTNYVADWVGQNSDNEPLADGTYFVIFTSGGFSFETYVDVRR